MRSWLAVCALLGAGAAAVALFAGFASPTEPLSVNPLVWEARGWIARPWTLWTSAWVHSSAGALAGNLLALAALAVAGAALGARGAAAVSLLVAWPLGVLGLLAWSPAPDYAGLGGPIHAAAAVLAVHLGRHASLKSVSTLIVAGLALKLGAEHPWTRPVAFDPSWGFNVVYAAHLSGALAGALASSIANRLWPAANQEAAS